MLEQTQNKSTAEENPPFSPGDLVVVRNKDQKLKSFEHYIKGDIGLVISLEKIQHGRWKRSSYIYTDKWDVVVMWQQTKQKRYNYGLTQDYSKLWHTRLKKIS